MTDNRTPEDLSESLCNSLPVGTALLGLRGYWKGSTYVKTGEASWAMFHKRPTPAEVWQAVEERRNNLSPCPTGRAYVYAPPEKPVPLPDPENVRVGDTVTLTRDKVTVMGPVDRIGKHTDEALKFWLSDGRGYPTNGYEAWTLTEHLPKPVEYETGTVAEITVRGCSAAEAKAERAIRTNSGGWCGTDGVWDDVNVEHVRPLVVIDTEKGVDWDDLRRKIAKKASGNTPYFNALEIVQIFRDSLGFKETS